jgi:hypothetical protein
MSEIPPDLKEMFERLHDEGMELMAHFAVYDQLFNHSEKRYEIVHKCSPIAIYFIQNALENEILMSLNRLTDKPGVGRKESLSFPQFHLRLVQSGEENVVEKLRAKIRAIRKTTELIRKHRNTRLAHLNRKIVMKEDPGPDRLSVEHMEKAIKAFQEYFSEFQNCFDPKTEHRYDLPVTVGGDALFIVLLHGLLYRKGVEEGKFAYMEIPDEWKEACESKPITPPGPPKVFIKR